MLKSRLVIAGAGDLGREVLWIASEVALQQGGWAEMSFIDDDVDGARRRLHGYQITTRVVGAISDFTPQPQDLIVCAIANPKAKLAVCTRLKQRGARFASVIHPSVAIAPRVHLGQGVIVARSSILGIDAHIGDFVTINCNSCCGHDSFVDEGCTVSCFCDITGHAHLERGVFLGSHASVLPSVRIGEFAVVGAGTVAVRNVTAGKTAVGVPARTLP